MEKDKARVTSYQIFLVIPRTKIDAAMDRSILVKLNLASSPSKYLGQERAWPQLSHPRRLQYEILRKLKLTRNTYCAIAYELLPPPKTFRHGV